MRDLAALLSRRRVTVFGNRQNRWKILSVCFFSNDPIAKAPGRASPAAATCVKPDERMEAREGVRGGAVRAIEWVRWFGQLGAKRLFRLSFFRLTGRAGAGERRAGRPITDRAVSSESMARWAKATGVTSASLQATGALNRMASVLTSGSLGRWGCTARRGAYSSLLQHRTRRIRQRVL